MSDTELTLDQARFVLLGVQTSVGLVRGFAVAYTTEDDAATFFTHLYDYLTAIGSRSRSFDVRFTTSGTTATLNLDVAVDNTRLTTAISEIPIEDVARLIESLETYKYYFILSGSVDSAGTFHPLRPNEYHIFKADFWHNARHLFGKRDGLWPDTNPFADT